MPIPRAFSFVLALSLSLTLHAQGDEFVFKGSRLTGALVAEEGLDLVINPYNSKNPRMTFGVLRRPKASLLKRIPDADPVRVYLSRWATHAEETPDDADAEVALGDFALAEKWHAVADEHFLRALALKKDHPAAAAKIDPKSLAIAKRADRRLNGELDRALTEWRKIEGQELRKKAFERIVADFGWNGSLVELERARRSAAEPKGRRDDIALSYRSKTDHGVYTIKVPESYDPLTPIPLVLALHGGGPDGKDRKGVIGSGKSAMNFYESGAERNGMIVVCPTAVEAPWSAPVNDSFVLSVLEEVLLLWNIDMNRVYLTGHSMGGFGTWWFGPKYAHLWAAIAPMSGGGHRGIERLVETKTGVYLYHGANDEVVSSAGDRAAAAEMMKRRMDFVYTEIPDSGHGFPQDVNTEMWRFFREHRLAVAEKRAEKGKFQVALEPYSSFTRKVTDDERLYFGAPGEDRPNDKKSLLQRLRLGGGVGRAAAADLATLKDATTVSPIGAVLADETAPVDQRVYAAETLQALAFAEGVPFLHKALASPDLVVVRAAASAMKTLSDKSSPKVLARAVPRVIEAFCGLATAKNDMDATDFERGLAAIGALAGAVAAVKDPSGAALLAQITKDVFLPTWNVPKSERAGVDPDRPLAAGVVLLLDAFAALGDPKAKDSIVLLRTKHGGLPGVAEAAERAAKATGG